MATRRRGTGGRAPAQVRQSQMLTSYGPGALVDLPKDVVLIGGLETWSSSSSVIVEERLQQKVARILGVPHIELRIPPPADQARTGVNAWRFPAWFLAHVPGEDDHNDVRRRPPVHASAARDRSCYSADKKKHALQPVRFVQACPNGHLTDIKWRRSVHNIARARPSKRATCTALPVMVVC